MGVLWIFRVGVSLATSWIDWCAAGIWQIQIAGRTSGVVAAWECPKRDVDRIIAARNLGAAGDIAGGVVKAGEDALSSVGNFISNLFLLALARKPFFHPLAAVANLLHGFLHCGLRAARFLRLAIDFVAPPTGHARAVLLATAGGGLLCRHEPYMDDRILIERLNGPMLFEFKATPAEYKAGLDRAIANGWLVLHESGTSYALRRLARTYSHRNHATA
jgi:hypothetical protein